MTKIRTRFAPSPTGRMHVGNLRTALYAYLIAKHEDGDFILRIEDTDQERYVEGAVDIIYRTMAGTGLLHDEGPDKDGGVGPYVQSERQASGIYLKYAQQLIEQGDAYYCFCGPEELESMKRVVAGKEISIYDKRCLRLSKEEVQRRLDAGEPHVIRFNMPTEGTTTFHDVIYGDITVNNEEMEDLILIKSDGYPTYNFANVVDDHLMGITHVVRGNEYLSSAPKYNRIYEAFGWEIPVYVHCPLITNEEHQKLSKRSGHSSYEDLLEQGFVTEAIVNFVALLGWSPQDNQEIFSLPELVKAFDYHHISKSPAVFDITKLRWMNGEYIKKMDPEEFYEKALPYMKQVLKRDYNFRKIAGMVQTRIETFPDIPALIDFFEEVPEYDSAMYCHKKMKTNEETSLAVLKEVHLRRADEAGDEEVCRMVEDLLRRADLLDEAVAHDDDAVAERHCLGLVVGDVDERGVDLVAQLDDLGAHLVAELGVEVGQRLVHQEDLRVPDDGAADGDTLPLAAGQRLRLAVEVLGDIEDLGGLTDLAVDLRLRGLLQLQGEGHVIINGHVGIQSIVLEDHGDIAVLRRDVVREGLADVQLALADLFQTGDHSQGGGLTAARRTDEDDELLVSNFQVEVRNRRYAAVVNFVDVFQRYACHNNPPESKRFVAAPSGPPD